MTEPQDEEIKEPEAKEQDAGQTADPDATTNENAADASEKQNTAEKSEAAENTENSGDAEAETEADSETEEPEKKKGFFARKHDGNAKKLQDELDKSKAQYDELNDRYMRLAAEYNNYKRRTAKEAETRYSDIKGDTLKTILPVMDNFERALSTKVPEGCESYTEGVKMIYTQLQEILKADGIEEIAEAGVEFDPNIHQAVMHIDDETLGANVVAEVFQKGYKIGGKVLRYAMVKVAN